MKPLSEHLSQLSVQARKTEDRVNQAQSEAREQIQQRREQLQQDMQQALDQARQRIAQVKDEAQTSARSLKAKIDTDFESLREQAQQDRRDFKAWQADNYAGDKEADAAAAIDYAIAAVRMAELQTLDAIDARAQAIGKEAEAQLPPVTA